MTPFAFLLGLQLLDPSELLELPQAGVMKRLSKIAGPDPITCPTWPSRSWSRLPDHAQEATRQCVLDARIGHHPFVFVIQGGGIDSFVATGLVGTTSGNWFSFWYDSSPCGDFPDPDDRSCATGFALHECSVPTMQDELPVLIRKCADSGRTVSLEDAANGP